MEWKALQNGSDIRGVAMEGVPGEEVNLGSGEAYILGGSFAVWLRTRDPGSACIAVGMDSRISGPELKSAFTRGVTQQGMDVIDCGLASTPAMFMATLDEQLNADAGVMLTASHLPFNRNGMKFFTPDGGLDKKDITAILETAASFERKAASSPGTVRTTDFISTYAGFLADTICNGVNDQRDFRKPLHGCHIIVDAGNGGGGFFASKVLKELGADTRGSQFLDPDGMFPNHVPNPEDPAAMDSICKAVVNNKAHLGIIFDTDVDRAAIVDRTGKPINRNALIALISAVILEEHPGSVIVTDSITSEGLGWFIEKACKGVHHRFKRGYKNVINESVRLNAKGRDSWLAIETSGHAALRENHFLDDGAYLVAKLLIKMAKLKAQGLELTSLIKDLPEPLESREFRLKIREKDFTGYGNKVLEAIEAAARKQPGWKIVKPNYEGLRVRCKKENGWFLLRLSLHDPLLPLNIEADVAGGVDSIAASLADILSGFGGLDVSPLRN